MSILYRYISREIFRYFGIIVTMVIGIYLAVDFIEKIDDFMETHLPLSKAVTFFIYKSPFIVAQIMPVGILLAVLVVFGLMNKNNEVTALKSSGISVYFLLKPAVAIGVGASVLLFGLSEVVVPLTMAKANHIWLQEVRKEAAVATRSHNIWIKGQRRITNIQYFDPADQSIAGIIAYRFNDRFQLIERIDARAGRFVNDHWVLTDVMEQLLDPATGDYRTVFHDEQKQNLDFFPADLGRVAKKSEEMSIFELSRYIKKVESEGYDATAYRVDFHGKLAFPLVCIVLCLAGTGLAVRGKIRREGIALSITYGLGLAFLYWIFYSFCISLGYGEMLPPFLAAWIANFVFLCFGVWALLNAE
jgi:lipopolysaccharide export system permease protein